MSNIIEMDIPRHGGKRVYKRKQTLGDTSGWCVVHKRSKKPIHIKHESYEYGKKRTCSFIPVFATVGQAQDWLENQALYKHTSSITKIKLTQA